MANSASERIINRLDRIYAAQGAGGASFEELTGEPTDNAALGTALSGKVPTTRTVNGQALSGNVVVTGLMLDTTGAPDNGVGANGDYAFDDATKTIYGPKAAGVWPAGVVLGAPAAPYLVYTALLTQTGTDAPVETVLQETLTGTPVWTYEAAGRYILTLAGAFLNGKVPKQFGLLTGTNDQKSYSLSRIDDDSLRLTTNDSATPTDEMLAAHFFEIRVYP